MSDATGEKTCQWIALRLLAYAGITSLAAAPSPPAENASYVVDGDLEDIAGIITASLQDLFHDGGARFSEAPLAFNLRPPYATLLQVTPGQRAVTVPAGTTLDLTAYSGCTVQINGDPWTNTLTNGTGLLARPYGGTAGGTQPATLYGDAILLPQDALSVLEPVRVAEHLLAPCADADEFERAGGRRCGQAYPNAGPTGFPCRWWVESRYDDTLDYLPLWLRFAPVPAVAVSVPVSCRVRQNPPTITAEDLGDDTLDPGVTLPVPGRMVESVLLPYCLQRFTGHPLYKNEAAKGEIARQFQAAQSKVKAVRPMVARQQAGYKF